MGWLTQRKTFAFDAALQTAIECGSLARPRALRQLRGGSLELPKYLVWPRRLVPPQPRVRIHEGWVLVLWVVPRGRYEERMVQRTLWEGFLVDRGQLHVRPPLDDGWPPDQEVRTLRGG